MTAINSKCAPYHIAQISCVVGWSHGISESSFLKTIRNKSRQAYRATWNGAVLAESTDTLVVEGNQYFPMADVQTQHLRPSESHTTCHWKGEASYYDLVVGDKVNRDAAWYYPNPSAAAERINGRVAFWHGVKVDQVEA